MESTFADDLRASAMVLRRHPLLPLLSFLLIAGPPILETVVRFAAGFNSSCLDRLTERCRDANSAAGVVGLLTLPLVIFSIGWVGTERIWFMRVYRGKTMNGRDGWRLSWSFFGRYFVLGLLIAMTFTVAIVVYVATRSTAILLATSIPIGLAVDFWLTFVTPALAFSTRKVGEALSIGWWELIKREWPRAAPYVFVPPLVIVLLGRQLPPKVLGLWGSIVVTGVGVLMNLWFKGATAAFYLRAHAAVGDDGAADARPAPEYPNVPQPGW